MAIYGGPSKGNASRPGDTRAPTPVGRAQQKDGKKPVSIWRIASALFTGIVVVALPMFHANTLMYRTMRVTFPDYDVDYRASWPRLLGGVTASDVRVLPFGDDEPDEVFTFDRVTLRIPFFEYYRSMFKRSGMLNGINRIEMVFEGGHGSISVPLVPEMGVFGNVSLSPFEAEGCVEDNSWVDAEFDGMGLPNAPLDMTLVMAREDGKSILDARLAKAGIGELTHRSVALLNDKAPLLASYATDDDEPVSEEWHLRDEAFVPARNRHCARKDGVTEAEFIERHVFTVRRALEAVGMAPDPALEIAYRDFATRGGTLDVTVTYGDMSRFVVTESTNLGNLLDYLRTGFTINGRVLGETMNAVHARDLPTDDDALSSFALLRREWDARAAASPVAADAEPATPVVPARSAPASAPAVASPVAAVVMATAMPSPAVASIASATVPVPAEIDLDTITDYRMLGRQAGQRFVVHFRNKSPMRIEVVGMDGGSVRVRRWMQSGWAEHLLDRAGFDRAERQH